MKQFTSKLKAIWHILTHDGIICIITPDWEGVIIDYKDRELKMNNLTEGELAELLTTKWTDEEIDNTDTDTQK